MGLSHPKLSEEELDILTTTTRFSVDEIQEWHEVYYDSYPDGLLGKVQFTEENMNSHGGKEEFWNYIFDQMDSDMDGFVNFTEFLQTVSTGTRGNDVERFEWIFRLYDKDGSGFIEYDEMLEMLSEVHGLTEVAMQSSVGADSGAPLERCQAFFNRIDTNHSGRVDLNEFLQGCKADPNLKGRFNAK